ncbi:hypothetical protein CEXT_680151 [Caerostris extrusa]|uniref:Maturase K n=1 Tax=Caerostris extrusa TaxID=172846 RepID=A0AAV4QQ05_CAEEX|nr:hypothetical protein CEXT_680151 [Caerostris extrusa]
MERNSRDYPQSLPDSTKFYKQDLLLLSEFQIRLPQLETQRIIPQSILGLQEEFLQAFFCKKQDLSLLDEIHIQLLPLGNPNWLLDQSGA